MHQNAPFQRRKYKNLHHPTPIGEGDTPSPDPTPARASIPRTPSKPHFWLRAWSSSVKNSHQSSHFYASAPCGVTGGVCFLRVDAWVRVWLRLCVPSTNKLLTYQTHSHQLTALVHFGTAMNASDSGDKRSKLSSLCEFWSSSVEQSCQFCPSRLFIT